MLAKRLGILVLAGGLLLPAFSAAEPAHRVKSGTGFFVSHDGFLVTSAHVVTDCPSLSIWGSNGGERPGYIIAADRRRDVALLWADGSIARQSAVAAPAPPHAGEEVFTLGFGVVATQPLQPVIAEGSFVGDSTSQPGNRILVIRARLHAGNSGGAVLAADGSLLGMVIGRDRRDPDLGVAIPGRDIGALLAAYGIALPQRRGGGDARQLLGAISVLIQCTAAAQDSPAMPQERSSPRADRLRP